MEWIDLRSDTVTQPTPEMRKAMAEAVVGDDVFGEDPTINRLQDMAAEITGKEAGLFVASGTMGNLAAVLSHCNRGDEVILGNLCHTFIFEAGGISALGGVHPFVLHEPGGWHFILNDVKNAIRKDDVHFPQTRLVMLENTHNRCGGVVLRERIYTGTGGSGPSNGLQVHLDGARIFNAAAALGVKVEVLTRPVDSVTFCLSKGLCAPVGSVLMWQQRIHPKSTPDPEATGWRNAPGRDFSCSRDRSIANDDGQINRGSSNERKRWQLVWQQLVVWFLTLVLHIQI